MMENKTKQTVLTDKDFRSIIKSVRDFFLSCPLLKDGKLNVDYLGAEPTEYVIEGTPVADIARQYTDGASLRRYHFIFGSREYYGSELQTNLENNGFYEQLAEWIEGESRAGNLPRLGNGKAAQRLEVLSTGYLFDANGKDARYQIQCALLYFQNF